MTSSISPWKGSSRFSSYIEQNPTFFSLYSMQPSPISYDDESVFLATNALRRLSARLPNVHPLAQRLQEILIFAEDFQSCSTSWQSRQLFEKLQPLRAWLFWMPVMLVKANDMGSSAMVLLAQLYTVAMAIDSSIPELSGAALGSLSILATDRIDYKLRYKQAITTWGETNLSDLDELMEVPRMMLARHRTEPMHGHHPLEDTTAQDSAAQSLAQSLRQHSPYSYQQIKIGSQPGTPNYPPPTTPGFPATPPMLSSHSFEDLSHPPSPFLRYESPISRPHSQLLESSPRPSSMSFDNRSLSGYSHQGDSPAYSPAAYSPGFVPNIPDDDAWSFGGHSPGFGGGLVPSAA